MQSVYTHLHPLITDRSIKSRRHGYVTAVVYIITENI